MNRNNSSTTAFYDSKPHYHLLDGLRGVAALTVLGYHIFEAFATSPLDQTINHGYLAVDFFFILSGFVIGYAYDDRRETMTASAFIRRRLIRLHPMVVMGTIIGALLFYTQGCEFWKVSDISIAQLLLATLLGMLLIPSSPGFEIRGIGEMFPLNGPTWSLFFEYIGNLLYVFVIRRLSTRALSLLVIAAGIVLIGYAVTADGYLGVGWTLANGGFWRGLLRLIFAFPAGLLLSRLFHKTPVRGAFWLGAAAIIMVTAMPRIGGSEHLWLNGLYDAFCVVFIFPFVIWLGASGQTTDDFSTRLCNFLGDISYPLYIVHYPFIYLYYAWVKNNHLTFVQSVPGAAALVVCCIALAWLCLKYYDIPIRKRLKSKGVER